MTLLADPNVERHVRLLLGALQASGWAQLLEVRIATVADIGLSIRSSDREVWRRAQELDMVLLTDNRNQSRPDSLEQTLLDELTPTSLPVLTFGSGKRFLADREYRINCAERVAEIIVDIEQYRGVTRLYVP
jgi:hypothetical protein